MAAPGTDHQRELADRLPGSNGSGLPPSATSGEPAAPRVDLHLLAANELETARRLWQSLEARVGEGAITSSWDWTETWLQHYGDLVPHAFAVGDRGGTPCGIVLLTYPIRRKYRALPIRSVHLGTAGEPVEDSVYVEYNRLLVAPEARDAFATALVSMILRSRRWDELVLDGFAPEDAEPLLRAAPMLQPERAVCPVFDLDTARKSGRDILELLGASTRKKLRRHIRTLEPLTGEWAETPEQARQILEDLILLHQERWEGAGQCSAFASRRFRQFHRALVPRLATRGAVLLFRMRAGSQTIGCVYGFIERGRVLGYQVGRVILDDSHLSPGLVTEALFLREALRRGLVEYNHLAGDSMAKRQLANSERELIWARARRPRPHLILLDGLRKARRLVRAPSVDQFAGMRGAR